ncbi:MAG: hypothetical protein AB1758_28185 [Candidatus Eremiobacterota bacterium]
MIVSGFRAPTGWSTGRHDSAAHTPLRAGTSPEARLASLWPSLTGRDGVRADPAIEEACKIFRAHPGLMGPSLTRLLEQPDLPISSRLLLIRSLELGWRPDREQQADLLARMDGALQALPGGSLYGRGGRQDEELRVVARFWILFHAQLPHGTVPQTTARRLLERVLQDPEPARGLYPAHEVPGYALAWPVTREIYKMVFPDAALEKELLDRIPPSLDGMGEEARQALQVLAAVRKECLVGRLKPEFLKVQGDPADARVVSDVAEVYVRGVAPRLTSLEEARELLEILRLRERVSGGTVANLQALPLDVLRGLQKLGRQDPSGLGDDPVSFVLLEGLGRSDPELDRSLFQRYGAKLLAGTSYADWQPVRMSEDELRARWLKDVLKRLEESGDASLAALGGRVIEASRWIGQDRPSKVRAVVDAWRRGATPGERAGLEKLGLSGADSLRVLAAVGEQRDRLPLAFSLVELADRDLELALEAFSRLGGLLDAGLPVEQAVPAALRGTLLESDPAGSAGIADGPGWVTVGSVRLRKRNL